MTEQQIQDEAQATYSQWFNGMLDQGKPTQEAARLASNARTHRYQLLKQWQRDGLI